MPVVQLAWADQDGAFLEKAQSLCDRPAGQPSEDTARTHQYLRGRQISASTRPVGKAQHDPLLCQGYALRTLHVQGYAQLIAVPGIVVTAVEPAFSPGCQQRLHLDHLGAEIRQYAGGIGARQHPGEVQDANVVKNTVVSHFFFLSSNPTLNAFPTTSPIA